VFCKLPSHVQHSHKVKGKVYSRTATKAQRGVGYRYTLSLTSALDGLGGQRHAPAALPPGEARYPLYRRPVWTGAENLASTGIRFLDRPTRSESLYRLHSHMHSTYSSQQDSCDGSWLCCVTLEIFWLVDLVSHSKKNTAGSVPILDWKTGDAVLPWVE